MALSIGENGSVTPFELALPQVPSSVDVTLQVVNDAVSQVIVLAWQLELELLPLEGAIGTLSFSAIDCAAESVICAGGGSDEHSRIAAGRAKHSRIRRPYDGAIRGRNKYYLPQRNILQLTIAADLGVSVAFQLVMRAFDPRIRLKDHHGSTHSLVFQSRLTTIPKVRKRGFDFLERLMLVSTLAITTKTALLLARMTIPGDPTLGFPSRPLAMTQTAMRTGSLTPPTTLFGDAFCGHNSVWKRCEFNDSRT